MSLQIVTLVGTKEFANSGVAWNAPQVSIRIQLPTLVRTTEYNISLLQWMPLGNSSIGVVSDR